jgi:hypothetical protein
MVDAFSDNAGTNAVFWKNEETDSKIWRLAVAM